MAQHARAADYNSEGSPATLEGRASSRSAGWTPPRAIDAKAAEELLQLLARAVQQFHTYPPTSPLCLSAVESCQRAVVTLGRDQFTFRVAPREVLVDDSPVGRGTLIETEIARRLHLAGVAQVTIEHAVSTRELTHFCCDLLACSGRVVPPTGLIDLTAEHGIDRIALRPAYRPEVLSVNAPSAPVAHLIEQQREHREQLLRSGGHVDHLYPPDKGWVRVDPSTAFPSVSLADLALLAEDPAALATMLVRLTDDGEADEGPGAALAQKFSDVATLFSALDPRAARIMFAKLARAVLDLDTDRRQALLRRTILPGLLDGRIDGAVLRDFPDVDLAESLCLLLDLETAAPEVVSTALARLDLPAERQAALMPLIEERVQGRTGQGHAHGLDAHARRLVRIDHERGRSFAEFSAFDLSLDAGTVEQLGQIRDGIATADTLRAQLACACSLVRLEANPDLVQRFLDAGSRLMDELDRHGRRSELADWLGRHRAIAESLRESRPDVAAVIDAQLAAMCTPQRAARLIEMADQDDESRAIAGRIVEALGPAIAVRLLETHKESAGDGRSRGAVQLLCQHAALVAPALVEMAGRLDPVVDRVIARVLGLAGRGYEAVLAKLIESRDEQTAREGLRGLARIGTAHAAAIVGGQIQKHRNGLAGAAEQTLWHFPPAEALREVKNLLARREFMLRRPDVAGRLLDRAAQSHAAGLEPILAAAVPLQYRFWSPSVMRLGRKARAMLKR